MAGIKVKTRTGVSPQGKARVYFSCHKKDFRKYFESMSDRILKTHNCAIYYYEPGETTDVETKELDLSQMQLFVVPVTENFLNTKNDAFEFDFKYATEHHIPILPIMEERGLAESFNRKCGNIQFLTTYNDDDETAISFSKKLQIFLDSVLVGDETAKKIRAAFDAYVFLSYRKKDRKYAQELMKLIHKNEFCRDIAIWYDEFLVPGENFNNAISDAMKKSKLFALLVTPNLVNEENYVMTTEYPMAKEINMPLLPAEALPTDRALLVEKFAGIPECTDMHNSAKLSKALMQNLKSIAVRSNDSSPEHNFFIGLAYLSGIDVEVDHERAVSLITFAAEKGLPEAAEKLANMYRIGEGVKRDYNTSIKWQEKYISILKNQANDESSPEKYLKAKYTLCTLYSYIENHEKIIEVATEILKEGESLEKTTDNKGFLFDAAIRVGRSCYALKKYDETEKVYEKLVGTLEENKTFENRLATVYNNLALLYKNTERYGAAEKLYLKALEIRERKNAEYPGRYDGECAQVYVNLGYCYDSLKKYEKAEELFRKALPLREKLAENGNNSALSNLAATYKAIASICISTNRYSEAETFRTKALEITEKLAKKNSVLYEKELAGSYGAIGSMYRDTERYKEAEEVLLKSLEIYRRKKEENFVLNAAAYAGACTKLAAMYRNMRRYREAVEMYLESISVNEKICETAPEGGLATLASDYTGLALTYRYMQLYKDAKSMYTKAIEIREKLYAENPDVHEKALAICYDGLGVTYGRMEMYDKAKEYSFKGLELREKVYKKNPTANANNLATGYNNIAVLYSNIKEKEKSIEYYKKCIEIREKLSEENPSVYEDELALTYSNLSYEYNVAGEMDNAIETALKAIEIREKLAKANPVAHEDNLATCYNRVGVFMKKAGRYKESEQYYIKAINIAEKLLLGENRKLYEDTAVLYHGNLALLYLDEKRYIRSAISFCRSAKRDKHKSYSRGLAYFFGELAQVFLKKNIHKLGIVSLVLAIFELKHLGGDEEGTKLELIKYLKELGGIYENKEDYRNAAKNYRKAMDLRVMLYKQNPEKYINDFADDRVFMAEFYEKARHRDSADLSHRSAISLRERACEKYGDYREKLASDYNRYGLYLRRTSFSFKAEEAFLNAIRINRKLGEGRKENLAINYFNLGFVYRDSKKPEKEVNAFDASLKLYMELAEKEPEKYKKDIQEGKEELAKAKEHQKQI